MLSCIIGDYRALSVVAFFSHRLPLCENLSLTKKENKNEHRSNNK